MKIHSTHAKKDLHEIIEVFQLYEVGEYKTLRKHELVPKLEALLADREYIPEENKNFYIKDLQDLKDYLRSPTTRQITSNSVRYDVTDRVRNLIFYGKDCGYDVGGSNYGTHAEVVCDALFVSNYGDLPAVRRAIRFYNLDPKTPTPLEAIMTRRVGRRVLDLAKQKKENCLSLTAQKGEFVLDFS